MSLSDYSRTTALCGVDISEPMLRKAQQRVRALGSTNVETLAVMDAKNLAFRIRFSTRWWRNMSSPRCRIRKRRWMISSAC
jgi:ubiquinone/menaquinone biosynthesis C-methylase UbiE